MNVKLLEKVLPVAGSVVLFISWAVQTLLFADWNATLARIGSAEAVFHSYRASDGVFRGLQLVAAIEQLAGLETQQEKNYDRGLAVVRTLVDSETYRSKREQVFGSLADGASPDQLSINAKIDAEYNAIQLALSAERAGVSTRKALAESTFLVLYSVGTLLVIAGGLVKLLPVRTTYGD